MLKNPEHARHFSGGFLTSMLIQLMLAKTCPSGVFAKNFPIDAHPEGEPHSFLEKIMTNRS